jgi:chromosome segregation ATPase
MQLFKSTQFILLLFTLNSISSIAYAYQCWTDENGNTACGDVVPPQHSQQGFKEVNPQGALVNQVGRAKTPEEIAAEKVVAQQKAKEEEEQKQRDAEEQKLLMQFSSENDIAVQRDQQLTTIDTGISITESQINSLQKNLTDMEKTLDELDVHKVLNKQQRETQRARTSENIDAIKHNMKYLQENLDSKHKERTRVQEEFAEYLVRYKNIMSRRRKMTPEEEAAVEAAAKSVKPAEAK